MPSYNYDIYIDDKLVAIVFEEDLAFAFLKACFRHYFEDNSLRYTIRRREKEITVDTTINLETLKDWGGEVVATNEGEE